jgi:hypothetical protein
LKFQKQNLPKRIGRKRRTAGWTLLALGLLVTGVGVWSGWWRFNWRQNDRRFHIFYGHVWFGVVDGNEGDEIVWNVERHVERSVGWEFRADNELTPHDDSLVDLVVVSYKVDHWSKGPKWHISLWPIPLLLWTPAALLLRSGILARRRATTGHCAKCGYSLAGLAADAPCPECGTGS